MRTHASAATTALGFWDRKRRWLGCLFALALPACMSAEAYNEALPASKVALAGGADAMEPRHTAGFVSAPGRTGAMEQEWGAEGSGATAPQPRADDRLRIYKARVDVLVPGIDDAVARFLALVEKEGGYLENRVDGEVTCRVPAAKFRAVVDAVKRFGTVLKLAESVEDVTRQHQDLTIRIENAEKSRARLLELLAKATETESLLKIEQELRRLTEEIERMQADLRLLSQQVAYSTVQAAFRSKAPEVPVSRDRANRFRWLDQVGPEPMLEDF